VGDAFGVGGLHGLHQPQTEVRGAGGVPGAAGFDLGGQRPAGHPWHDDPRAAEVVYHVVDRDDVGVGKPAGVPRFGLELVHNFGQPLFGRGLGRAQLFDRHRKVELLITGIPDDALLTAAKLSDEPVSRTYQHAGQRIHHFENAPPMRGLHRRHSGTHRLRPAKDRSAEAGKGQAERRRSGDPDAPGLHWRIMDRVAVVYNARSGAFLAKADKTPQEQLTELFGRWGVAAELRAFDPVTLAADVPELLAGAPDALMVVGGDGTIRSVAERLLGSEVPLGIVPAGTMNVLARDLGIPFDLDGAVEALLTAPVARIDVATVNDQPFLCSSMLAMMPHLGRIRETARGGLGLGALRLVGRAWRLVRRYPRMKLTIVVDGREHEARTRAMVVSCNPLAAGPPPVPGRDRLDAGLLAVYVAHDRTNWDLVAVATKLFHGNWQQDVRIRRYQGKSVQVRSSRLALMSVMSDGEIAQLSLPLRYEIQPRTLKVLAPGAAA
jgi:diacylglycerol kinase family enzyme